MVERSRSERQWDVAGADLRWWRAERRRGLQVDAEQAAASAAGLREAGAVTNEKRDVEVVTGEPEQAGDDIQYE